MTPVERNASVRGRTVSERLEHVTKTTLNHVGRNLEHILENLLLQRGLVWLAEYQDMFCPRAKLPRLAKDLLRIPFPSTGGLQLFALVR